MGKYGRGRIREEERNWKVEERKKRGKERNWKEEIRTRENESKKERNC